MPPEGPVTRILLMLQDLRSRGRLAHPYNPVWNLWTIPRRTGLVDHRAVGSDSIVERTSGTVEVFARQVIHKKVRNAAKFLLTVFSLCPTRTVRAVLWSSGSGVVAGESSPVRAARRIRQRVAHLPAQLGRCDSAAPALQRTAECDLRESVHLESVHLEPVRLESVRLESIRLESVRLLCRPGSAPSGTTDAPAAWAAGAADLRPGRREPADRHKPVSARLPAARSAARRAGHRASAVHLYRSALRAGCAILRRHRTGQLRNHSATSPGVGSHSTADH